MRYLGVTLKADLRHSHQDHGIYRIGSVVYVFGGYDYDLSEPMTLSEAFSTDKNAWRLLPKMPRALRDASAARLGPKLYIFGRDCYTAVTFDPILLVFSILNWAIPTSPERMVHHRIFRTD